MFSDYLASYMAWGTALDDRLLILLLKSSLPSLNRQTAQTAHYQNKQPNKKWVLLIGLFGHFWTFLLKRYTNGQQEHEKCPKYLIDICRIFHPKRVYFTFFSSAHKMFFRICHIFGHKSSLGKFFFFWVNFKKLKLYQAFFLITML